MAEPYIGEIRPFSFGLIPRTWAPCQGQLLAVAQYQALFSLIGTTYGGDGQRTFGLPDLRGRVPGGRGPTFPLGQRVGGEQVTLNINQVPPHTHMLQASPNVATTSAPKNNFLAQASARPYVKNPPAEKNTELHPASITPQGGQPHENRQPYLAISFCIALLGIFPPRP
ncbi:MAG: phage tail protein [Solirubrobacteraceae bacterium]